MAAKLTRSSHKRDGYGKRLWQAFVISAIKAVAGAGKVVPLPLMLGVGSAFGDLAYFISGRYRAVAFKNLIRAYGDALPETRRRGITRGVFRNFGKAVFEFPCLTTLTPEQLRRIAHLDDADRERIDRALAGGRGILAFSAHIGNFELMARRFALEGYKFMVVVRNDRNAALAETVNRLRSRGGYDVIGRGDAARPILKHLKRGGIVGMLTDQRSLDISAPFFGLPSGTVAGPAVLALKTGVPLVPIFCIRQADDTHRVVVMEPFHAIDTGDADADILRTMTEVNRITEEVVRQHPDQWLWLHDRWRPFPSEVHASEPDGRGKVPSSAC